jgi:glutamyl-tRNA synthetase
MSGTTIRVRIAPSPTGFAHVGTAYTALFNFAYAKKNKGKFVLRLEDTDIKREVKGAEEAIYNGLAWLGLTWDEGPDLGGKYNPYRQSERLEIYKKKAEELLINGYAYKEEKAIRFKNPGNDISWKDLIRGDISFPGGEVTDFVLIKSDGYPTYNFAVVVDDILMEISHVIRGEEHISNTPRQLALYHAFAVDPPQFAHLPTLRNAERKKLSKRRDPVDLRFFQEQGYLPEALVNFLCLLGWSHPDEKEVFSLNEFVKLFDIKRVRSAGPIFNFEKLDWINGEYIRKLSVESLKSKFKIQSSKFSKLDKKKQIAITSLVRERIHKLSELDTLAGFFFEKKKVDNSLFEKDYKKHLSEAIEVLEKIDPWLKTNIDQALLGLVEKNGYKKGDFFMNLRVAITGSRNTPPINESIIILGEEETLGRLKEVIDIK